MSPLLLQKVGERWFLEKYLRRMHVFPLQRSVASREKNNPHAIAEESARRSDIGSQLLPSIEQVCGCTSGFPLG